MEYLAALGATEPAHEGQALRVPDLAPHHWQALNSADSGFARPQLDRRYDSWREEVGTLPDGRHSKVRARARAARRGAARRAA
jgi:hypothetical protein